MEIGERVGGFEMKDVLNSTACIVVPIPPNTPPRPDFLPQLGNVSQRWTYHDQHGHPVLYVCRFDTIFSETKGKMGKQFRPQTLWQDGNGAIDWKWKSLEDGRPLYNLHLISEADETVPILIVEGEKAADAAQALFPQMIATTSMNGANSVAKTDWQLMRGRTCLIAPDQDEAGEKYLASVIAELQKVGVSKIKKLDLGLLARAEAAHAEVDISDSTGIPEGYDLADALAAGWTPDRLSKFFEAHPDALCSVQGAQGDLVTDEDDDDVLEGGLLSIPGWNFRSDETGVHKIERRYDKKQKRWVEVPTWVCGPLRILGRARTSESEGWGWLVEITDPDSNIKSVVLPAADFVGTAQDAIRRLIGLGLTYVPSSLKKELLIEYICGSQPEQRVRFAEQTGWAGASFAVPEFSVGPETVICDLGEANNLYQTAGSFETWQKMAALATGNSRMALFMSMAFAGPLLGPLEQESGGINIYGEQGCGKSTILHAAGSAWGGTPGQKTFVRPWMGSVAAMEGVALASSDTFLVLDEVGQAKPDTLGEISYFFGNGSGNNRATTIGKLRNSASFRVMFASSGEKTMSQAIADNSRNGRAMGGQLQRILDVPADAGYGMGVVEDLHGFADSRRFVEYINQTANSHYGHAARRFLEAFISAREEAMDLVQTVIDGFVDDVCPMDASDQIKRAAKRFGLIAGAGELAVSYGILPWPGGEAISATTRCFHDWIDARGAHEFSHETIDAIRTVQDFISRHGEARFQRIRSRNDNDGNEFYSVVHNRVGFRKRMERGIQYIVLPEVFRSDVCRSHNVDMVLQTLKAQGLLELGEDGRPIKKMRLPDQKESVRCVVLLPGILSWPHHHDDDIEDEEDC